MNSNFSSLSSYDILHSILKLLPPAGLANPACVCWLLCDGDSNYPHLQNLPVGVVGDAGNCWRSPISYRVLIRSSVAVAVAECYERRFTTMATKNSYESILTTLSKPGGGEFGKYFSLPTPDDPRIDRLSYLIRILLVSAIRNCDGFQVLENDVEKILDWENTMPKQVEIPFKPVRVLIQDFTGVPASNCSPIVQWLLAAPRSRSDSFGRLHERSKEVPKTMKQLTRFFPNKISIQLPQDAAQLLGWKQQLDHDVKTLKAKSNNFCISSVMTRLKILYRFDLDMVDCFEVQLI